MDRFEKDGVRTYHARDALVAIGVAALLLVLFQGPSILHAGERERGLSGAILRSIGRPLSSVTQHLFLAEVANKATRFLAPEQGLATANGGFAGANAATASGIPPVTAASSTRSELGLRAAPKLQLHTMLVTGDSMSMPLDSILAKDLVPAGVKVTQEPHIGTGISNSQIVDWGKLAAWQEHIYHPNAVVIFIGANEGWAMRGAGGKQVSCCSQEWAALYAQRVRVMANIYRNAGKANVYWVLVPDVREGQAQAIVRVVDAAIKVGVQPWAEDVTPIDTVKIFTPNGYRDSMTVHHEPTIVREPDGVHLNAAGSALLAEQILATMKERYRF